MSYLVKYFDCAPMLLITAPEKRCGKTVLLSLINKLSYRSISASSISPAALFRTIELWSPTLCIDEADAFLKDNEELRGILNSGHTKDTSFVIRTVGDDHTPTKFNTYGAKAIAGIGRLAGTLEDRSIIAELRRKTPEEKVKRIRDINPAVLHELCSKFVRLAEDHGAWIGQARAELPNDLNDREQDNWQPLFSIAQSAGGDWMRIATEAAIRLSGNENVSASIGVELLTDIKKVFEEQECENIFTADLIKSLCIDDERRWKTYSKGHEITAKQLTSKLKEYKIHSVSVRVGENTGKGYKYAQFADAIKRYVPTTGNSAVTKSHCNNRQLK